MSRRRKPAEHRLFAIGDIHGCVDGLGTMLKAIAAGAGDRVVFVGDYIDRGPASCEVVELLLGYRNGPAEIICLKGNHEDMLLNFLGLPGRYGDAFIFNGGSQTLASYGCTEAEPEELRGALPQSHLSFFSGLRDSYRSDPFLFVHAGIQPGRPLGEQTVEDMLWIRQEFVLNEHQLGLTVVFGHTPMRTVMVDPPFKLGIDTGLVYGGKLSCIELTEGVLYQVSRGSHAVKKTAVDLG